MPKSKSAYSIPTKKQKSDTYIYVVWVDNEAGVLARVIGWCLSFSDYQSTAVYIPL